jgi:hypothetical protein
MTVYEVDDELAFIVDRLAPRNKPFEHLTFQEGLRRVIGQYFQKTPVGDMPELARQVQVENAVVLAREVLKKAPSPSASQWVSAVPQLKLQSKHLTTWKAITDHLEIETGGDSARRKLAAWVKVNKPNWPRVPEID